MASQTLLDALNRAIEALEYVRFELERENADQDMVWQALDALPTQSVDVPLFLYKKAHRSCRRRSMLCDEGWLFIII